MTTPKTNLTTVSSYSERGATAYEDPMNKNFLYGVNTIKFLEQIEFDSQDEGATILDIGCGTGFGFDVLKDTITNLNMKAIGVEPADGMLEITREKYGNVPGYQLFSGSFEDIPLADNSVDRIISTLALHWVKDLMVAAEEMKRVLTDNGRIDIFMIAKDDGARFKTAIVEAQKKHLTFSQIIKTAGLVQRVRPKDLLKRFSVFDDKFDVQATEYRDVVYGSFDDHMKWWKARSSPVIAEVDDKEQFMRDLEHELEQIADENGIPFDTAYLWITVRSK